MGAMKPFMLAAAALALFAIVLTFSAPPALAEGQELLQTEPEAESTGLGQAQKSEPDAQKTEAEAQKTRGKSPPWHKPPHHGHHGHHAGKPSHHDGKSPHHNIDKKKPYPSPPY